MTVRHATEEDIEALDALGATAQAEVERALAANALFVAEEAGELVGFASAWLEDHVARVGAVNVRGAPHRAAAEGALVETVIENLRARGATRVLLTAEIDSLSFYERLGFREESRNLVLALDVPELGGRSYGSVHVQTDDLGAVERAVHQFVPRLPGKSRGSTVAPPRNGWIAVHDDVCDRDPSMLRRLAGELSERLGAVVLALGVEHEQVVRFVLLEAGRVVDEYLSVPEHYGPLPPGDAIALAANPRVVSRLTGADPAAVRAAAQTAASPHELPPAQTLLEEIAAAIGIEGADHGWEGE